MIAAFSLAVIAVVIVVVACAVMMRRPPTPTPTREDLDLTVDDYLSHPTESRARELARRRPIGVHEERANEIVRLLYLKQQGLDEGRLRVAGEELCSLGGSSLMVLVAHRVQHLADPGWQHRQQATLDALRRSGRNVGGIVGSGPLVRSLEFAWDGICGWQH